MPVSYIASTTGTTTATLPAGTTSGDIVVVFAYATATTAPTLPASWTNITSGTTTMALRVQYRIYDGVWTMPTFTNAAQCHALTFRGQHATTPVGVTSCTGTSASNVTWPLVTLQDASGDSALVRGCGHTRPDSVISAPSGHTSRQAAGTQPGYITHTKNVTTDGGAATSTISRNTTWTQAQVEIRSVPAAPVKSATVGLTATSTLTVGGFEEQFAAVAMTATSTLTTDSTITPAVFAAVDLVATSTLTTDGSISSGVPGTYGYGTYGSDVYGGTRTPGTVTATVALTATSRLTATVDSWPQPVDNGVYRDVVLADNPIAYFRLDEGAGTTMIDSSVNAKHGTYSGSPVFNERSGPKDSGTAIILNGTTQYGEAPADPIYNQPTFSAEAWVKFTSNNDYMAVLDRRTLSGGGFTFRIASGYLQLSVYNGGTQLYFGGNAVPTLQNGRWRHVAVTVDGTNVRWYVDGAPWQTLGFAGTVPPTTDGLRVGFSRANAGDTPTARFVGSIDEVAYYAGVLSASRIAAHWAAGVLAATVPLTAVSTLTVDSTVTPSIKATIPLTATSTLTVVASQVVITQAAVALTATSTLTTDAVRTSQASVALSATSTLTVGAYEEAVAAVALTATSTLTTTATTTGAIFTAVALTATSTLTTTATTFHVLAAAVSLSATSTLTTVAVRAPQASVSLVAAATLTVVAVRVAIGSVSLVASSTLIVNTVRTPQAGVSLTASSTLVTLATVTGLSKSQNPNFLQFI